jgi:uncharacterized protein YkwD
MPPSYLCCKIEKRLRTGRNMKFHSSISLVICLTLLFTPFPGLGQSTKIDKTDYLSPLEKAVVNEMNLARTSPKEYLSLLEQFKKYYDGKLLKLPGETPILTKEGTSAVVEAIRSLRSQKPVSPLSPSKGMTLGAKDHIRDLRTLGASQHKGSDGSETWDRVNRYGTWQKIIGENISFGHNKARNIVMTLMIDDGVPNRGHRKNIFNPGFRLVGVACGDHPAYRTICVITFAGGYREKD